MSRSWRWRHASERESCGTQHPPTLIASVSGSVPGRDCGVALKAMTPTSLGCASGPRDTVARHGTSHSPSRVSTTQFWQKNWARDLASSVVRAIVASLTYRPAWTSCATPTRWGSSPTGGRGHSQRDRPKQSTPHFGSTFSEFPRSHGQSRQGVGLGLWPPPRLAPRRVSSTIGANRPASHRRSEKPGMI
jgi:hypothetical protein